jgi:L-arabinokinase
MNLHHYSSYRVVSGFTHRLRDTESFLESLNSLPELTGDLIVTRAPGRLDVMGGIADYSGSLVLQLPIADAAHVALQKTANKTLRFVSLSPSETEAPREFEMSLAEFSTTAGPIEYQEAQQRFMVQPDQHWAAYIAGAFLVLMREKQATFGAGATIVIKSNVPEGKGVSSSAALEVATMQAVVAAFGIELQPQELAVLCQKVENLVAGAPCGLMDQMTSACGEAGHLLELLCQPSDLKGTLALPEDIQVWGLDSGIRHSVGGSDYGTVRTAAFMGYRMIAELAGLPVSVGSAGKVLVDDSRWNGYLANITPEEFVQDYVQQLPEFLQGRDFLHRFVGITDPVTSVKPEVDYPIRQATQHPVLEHGRVQSFARTIRNWKGLTDGPGLGELMFASHRSYSSCGLGSPGTDRLVDLVREMTNEDLYGARITGGGSGGTVAVIGRRGADAAIKKVAERYHGRTGYQPLVISGSSPGAGVFGHLVLQRS